MTTILIVAHVIVCFFLICIVLLQHGKGADIGATFGGSNQSVFGTEGPVPLLNKITTLAAIVFMGTSITLAYLSANKSTGSVMRDLKVQEQSAPAQQAPLAVPVPAQQAAQPEVPKAQPEQPAPKQQN
ncbi:preprotein translocase subunit SecG [Desulfobulbus propionicus]